MFGRLGDAVTISKDLFPEPAVVGELVKVIDTRLLAVWTSLYAEQALRVVPIIGRARRVVDRARVIGRVPGHGALDATLRIGQRVEVAVQVIAVGVAPGGGDLVRSVGWRGLVGEGPVVGCLALVLGGALELQDVERALRRRQSRRRW